MYRKLEQRANVKFWEVCYKSIKYDWKSLQRRGKSSYAMFRVGQFESGQQSRSSTKSMLINFPSYASRIRFPGLGHLSRVPLRRFKAFYGRHLAKAIGSGDYKELYSSQRQRTLSSISLHSWDFHQNQHPLYICSPKFQQMKHYRQFKKTPW